MESYDRLLLALEQLLEEARRVGDAGVREASLAILDAIDFAEELGMTFDEAERRRAGSGLRSGTWIVPSRQGSGDGCRRPRGAPAGRDPVGGAMQLRLNDHQVAPIYSLAMASAIIAVHDPPSPCVS
jgi:hypothetical protein